MIVPNFISDQYTATDEIQCVTLYLPAGDEFKHLLAGLYSLACNPLNYDNPESAQTDGLVAIWDNAYSLIDFGGCEVGIGSGNVDLFLVNGTVNGGTLTITSQANYAFNHVMYTDTTTGRAIGINVYLKPGKYHYLGNYAKSTDAGKADISVARVDTGATEFHINADLDLYGLANVRYTLTADIEIPSETYYHFSVSSTGAKNASSGGYRMIWTSHHLTYYEPL